MERRLIVIDLFEGAEELDVVGPWEVLAYWTQNFPEDGWDAVIASTDGAPRRCAKGLALTPAQALPSPEAVALVVEPGGQGSRQRLKEPAHLEWLSRCAASGALMTSVCTGALVLAAAGLLHGRRATTYHDVFGELKDIEPSVVPCSGERFVDEGKLVTSAGVSAGIDMALHLVGRLSSPQRAQQVQFGIEYFPDPPTWDES